MVLNHERKGLDESVSHAFRLQSHFVASRGDWSTMFLGLSLAIINPCGSWSICYFDGSDEVLETTSLVDPRCVFTSILVVFAINRVFDITLVFGYSRHWTWVVGTHGSISSWFFAEVRGHKCKALHVHRASLVGLLHAVHSSRLAVRSVHVISRQDSCPPTCPSLRFHRCLPAV